MQKEHKSYNHTSQSFAEALDIDIDVLVQKMVVFQESLSHVPLRPSEIIEKIENLDISRRELAFLYENNAEILRLARNYASKSPLFQFGLPTKVEQEPIMEITEEEEGNLKIE